MSEIILDVTAEHPEIEHIAAEMKETAVHEHAGQESQMRIKLYMQAGLYGMEEVVRNHAECKDRPVNRTRGGYLHPENDHIDDDKEDCDERESGNRAVAVKRKHGLELSPEFMVQISGGKIPACGSQTGRYNG